MTTDIPPTQHSSTPLLQVQKLSVSFHGRSGEIDIVKGVSFSVSKGETLALVGESGSGKSLTALSILKLLPYPKAFHPTGEILFQSQDLLTLTEQSIRKVRGNGISMIFQEPMTSLNPLHTIERQIKESLLLHRGLTGNQATSKTLELLELVGIPEAEKRLRSYPHELSGGQKQRVMIAMALANEPELLIADEPTTALDVTVQKQVLELLKELQSRLGMAILLITHDLNIVRRYADRVCVMKNGQIVEQGETATLFAHPEQAYTRELLNAEPDGCPEPISQGESTLLEADSVQVWFPISKNFFGKPREYIKAVNQISLTLQSAETLGIVGESGSGKTTLAMAILKLTESQGQISFLGQAIHNMSQKSFRPLRKELQVVFQDPYGSLSPRMSICQIVEEGLALHGSLNPKEREQRVIQTLEEVGIDPEHRHRFPHEFSGGQRQRVAIARALILQPKLIVLDEPTSALDRTIQKQVIELLRNLQLKHQISYLFISHDLAVVRALSHRIIVMKNGEIVESGSTETIFNQPQTDYTQSLLAAAVLNRPVSAQS